MIHTYYTKHYFFFNTQTCFKRNTTMEFCKVYFTKILNSIQLLSPQYVTHTDEIIHQYQKDCAIYMESNKIKTNDRYYICKFSTSFL